MPESAEPAVLLDVDLDAALPASLPTGEVRAAGDAHRYVVTYFDTSEDDLRRAGVRLRREQRVEGSAWILALPGEQPLRRPDAAVVPAPFADLLLGARRGGRLRTVTRLTVRTQGYEIGRVRLVDERVEAAVPGSTGAVLTWRRLRIVGDAAPDSAEPDPAAVDRTVKALRKGRLAARRARLDDLDRARPLPSSPPDRRPGRTAADLLGEYVAEQCRALLVGDLGLRRGHDVVHPTRVATRRLRSTLRVFAEFVDPAAAAALDAELVWYAALLGEVRDREVLRRRLDAQVAELPDELVLGPVAARIATTLEAERAKHLDRVGRTLRGARYRALVDEIARWRAAPPFTDAAEGRPSGLTRAVDRAGRKLERRLRAGLADDQPRNDEALHSARKAAKRLRYAVELLGPATGKKQRSAGERAKKLQTVLGEHQDATVAAEVLRRMGAAAGRERGENGFTFGLLLEAERRRAAVSRAGAAKIARRP